MIVSSSQQAPRVVIGMAGRLFFGSLCAGTFGLGTWQALRYREKVALVEQRTHDLQQEPLTYGSASVAACANDDDTTARTRDVYTDDRPNFRRLQLTGRFQHEREFLVGPRGPPKGALPQAPGTSSGGMSSAPQGFLVVTPMVLVAARKETSVDNNENDVTILVNRGWVPMQQVLSGGRNASRYGNSQSQQKYQQLRARGEEGKSSDDPQKLLLQWERPSGDVTVTVVPGTFEEPKFLVAQHNLEETPPRLYWFDLSTMLKLGGMDQKGTGDNKTNKRLVLATQVQENNPEPQHSDPALRQWPVRPTAEAASEFKISPLVHAGYAFTWYSLSAAGVYMTRQLLQRGGRK